MAPQRLDAALFGMGCFYDSEPRFGVVKGVWRTTVGYAGGKSKSPSHDDAGDHIEAVMVEYDPVTISYGQLLESFLMGCDPERPCVPQHALRVFAKNDFEKRLAHAALERYKLRTGRDSQTRVVMCRTFHEAERSCQKHLLQEFSPLMEEINLFYPDEESLIRSTLATRINGILGQKISAALYLPEDIEYYDLSESALHILKQLAV